MKCRIFASVLLACLPWFAMAQSNDDLYFIPKKEKKAEKKAEEARVAPKQSSNTTVYAAPGSTVIVKDAAGKTRDVDEYNRRYSSRDYAFSWEKDTLAPAGTRGVDTLVIQEKPYNERGEWVNGFEGSQEDYEYAMRIVRFRSPSYAIPVSSPLYWDVVYGAYPSWDWNVYDDGMYAYIFPTYSNPLWWNWRWNWSFGGPYWGFSVGWGSPWYCNSWYSPYWYGGYWGGYWGPGWHHHHYAGHGWAGGWHRAGHTDYRAGRYQSRPATTYRRPSGSSAAVHGGNTQVRRPSSATAVRGRSAAYRSSVGRVVRPSDRTRGSAQSVRPNRTSVRSGSSVRRTTTTRPNSNYVRPSASPSRSGSTYSRPSSTRRSAPASSVRNSGSYNRSSRGSSVSRSSGGYSRSSAGGGVSRSGGGARRR